MKVLMMADKISPKPRTATPPPPPPAKSRSKGNFRRPSSSPSPSRAGDSRPSFGGSRRFTPSGSGRPAGGYQSQFQSGSFQRPQPQNGGFQRPSFQSGASQRPQVQNTGFQRPQFQPGSFQRPQFQNPAFPSPPPLQGFMPPFNPATAGYRPGQVNRPVGVPLPGNTERLAPPSLPMGMAGGATGGGAPLTPSPNGTGGAQVNPVRPGLPAGYRPGQGVPPGFSTSGRVDGRPPGGGVSPGVQTGSPGFRSSDRVLEADPARTLERGDAALRDLRAEETRMRNSLSVAEGAGNQARVRELQASLTQNQARIRDLDASLSRVRGFGALDPSRMSPDQIRGVNDLRANTMAQNTDNPWGDNHVRFGVSRQDEVARANHFNDDLQRAFNNGATSLHGALADVSRATGRSHNGRQESTASQNFSNLASSWNTSDNGRVDRRVLVADHGDFPTDTRRFVETMQSRFGLNLGNDENGQPRTVDSVMAALKRGETVQAGNFIFTRPQNQAQLERAFGDLASFNGERAVYVNGHGGTFGSVRDNPAQRGLEGNQSHYAESDVGRISVDRNFWVDQSRRLDNGSGRGRGAIPWIFDTCHSSPMLSFGNDSGLPRRDFG
jgi:hypothetical protein